MYRKLAILLTPFSFTATLAGEDLGVRVLLGITDTASTVWDGSLSATGATITGIEPWRFEGTDAILTGNSWKCRTHPIRYLGMEAKPVVANGIIVRLKNAGTNASLNVNTVRGSFTISLPEIAYGRLVKKLNNMVMVDRIPPLSQLTNDAQEQDYPAIAAGNTGEIWLAWMEFSHSPVHDNLRKDLAEAPADFNMWSTPPGGDRIWARRYAAGVWSQPIAITNGGEDLYRPAIAVDGQNRTWVFWSAQNGNNFDLWARSIVGGVPGDLRRITSAEGSDIDPVATSDSSGRVWVAWQGWRNGRASIFAARQKGVDFTAPQVIGSSTGNEWNPAIAADSNGRVTVAWDSYRNGNYDIYMRTAQNGVWGAETPVAASARYEAYPSIAYAPGGRLWIAYEEGSERWGKDWGAYETTGVKLYLGRAIRLRGYETNGQAVEPTVDAGTVLPGPDAFKVDTPGRQADFTGWFLPQPDSATKRPPSKGAPSPDVPKNTSPRLHVDRSGRLWLAFRSPHPTWWNPIGWVWSEYVVSYDGEQWTGPVFLSQSDNILDNRPAIVSPSPGRLLVVGSCDRRRQYHLYEKNPPVRGKNVPDPYNNDLFANNVFLRSGTGSLNVRPATSLPNANPDPEDAIERAGIDRIHAVQVLGRYRILVGEFHRHSELSEDGGGDGSILDQWRYILDPAFMDWAGCCDHDNGKHREYSWWITQKLTDIFHVPGQFVSMFSYERSLRYPEGHRNVVFAQRGIHTLARLPISSPDIVAPAPDTLMLYRYLRQFNGVVAAHTSATSLGTDWRNNDPEVEPFVEIYQGERQNYERPDASRTITAKDAIGQWRPKGFINLALNLGYKFGFQASSDHESTHMSYCNVLVEGSTRAAVLDAFKKRHVYAATDVILAEVTSGQHIMGDAFSTTSQPELKVSLAGTALFVKVSIIKDDSYVYMAQPGTATVEFTWRDTAPVRGKQSYYYVRGEQQNGEMVWASPMWITYSGN